MKYIKAYEQYEKIIEAAELDAMEVLHTIKNKSGGCSLHELLELYPDSSQIMTVLDTLTNQSAIELDNGKYKVVKN